MTAATVVPMATSFSAALVAGVFAYLHSTTEAAFLKYWTIHWSIVAIVLLSSLVLAGYESAWVTFGLTAGAVMGSVYLYLGASELRGQRAGDTWRLGVGAVLIWALVGAAAELPFLAETLPIYWARASLEIGAGVLILRLHDRFAPERLVAGIALVVGGVHLLGLPLLPAGESLQPWSDLISITVLFTSGIGMLLLYFRHARLELDSLHSRTLQSHRLEAMGDLAGDVGHDFNNVLMVIDGRAELLHDGVSEGGAHSLAAIRDAAERASVFTGKLLAFARRQRAYPRPVSLSESLEAMSGRLGKLVTEGIELRIATGTDLREVLIDPSQLDLVMENLVANARDALESTGTITISARGLDVPPAGSLEFPALEEGCYVAVEVSDDGAGMNEDTALRAFEPLFTTRGKGQGTGLGLSTVLGVVEQAGGAIRLESRLGQGTTVEVALPCAIRS